MQTGLDHMAIEQTAAATGGSWLNGR